MVLRKLDNETVTLFVSLELFGLDLGNREDTKRGSVVVNQALFVETAPRSLSNASLSKRPLFNRPGAPKSRYFTS